MLIGGIVLIVLSVILGLGEKSRRDHKLRLVEGERQSQLALEAQRYEKIREILTDGVIDGQPAAIEVLKPLVQVIADQMRSGVDLELKEMEQEHELALVEAKNTVSVEWMSQLDCMRKDMNNELMTVDDFERAVDKMAEATQKVCGISLQKALPPGSNKPSSEKE